jgi:hypothetical protein
LRLARSRVARLRGATGRPDRLARRLRRLGRGVDPALVVDQMAAPRPLTDHARRLLNMLWLRAALPRDPAERTITRTARLMSSSSPGSRDCAARRRPCSRSPRMSEISTSVTAFARSQANSIGHGTCYANAPSASACATARSEAAPRPSRGPGSACSASSPASWGASAPSWSRSSEPCCCSSCCTSSDPQPGGTSVARHAHPRPAPSRARSASA